MSRPDAEASAMMSQLCRPRRRALPSGLLLGMLVIAAGCESLRYPSAPPEPAPSAAAAAAPAAARLAPVWSDRAKAGREEIRAGDLQAAESHFRAALAATAELRPDDARAQAALVNLLRLGETYQQRGLYDDAARITSLVVDESRAGRGPDFAAAAPLLRRQALHLEQSDRGADAEPLYVAALGLAGAGPQAGAEYALLRLAVARLQIVGERFESAVAGLEQLLAELGAHADDPRQVARLALVVAEAGRGDLASAEREYRLAQAEAESAGPAAIAALAAKRDGFSSWLREAGREDEARFLEALAPQP